MITYSMRCIYCDNKKLYQLKTGQVKCVQCKKKFSIKKINQINSICESFCNNLTINETKQKLNLSYITVSKKYKLIRELISVFLEEQYQNKNVKQYDEYIYLEKSKKKVKANIFDAQNFLTFNYEDKVYNLLMPNLHRYKDQFLNDGVDTGYFHEFSKFMMFNKIAKIQNKENIIANFWIYFENEIVKYKGINNENFFYYLKEIEFKFNYSKEDTREILLQLLNINNQ